MDKKLSIGSEKMRVLTPEEYHKLQVRAANPLFQPSWGESEGGKA